MEKNFLLVLFYSASGSVKNLAHAIADGIEDVGLDVRLRTVPKYHQTLKKLKTIFQNLAKSTVPRMT